MITIKLPYKTTDEGKAKILEIQKEQNRLFGKVYQFQKTNPTQKEMTCYLNQQNSTLDSWFIQSAFYEGKAWLKCDLETYEDRLNDWEDRKTIASKDKTSKKAIIENKKLKEKPKLFRLFGGKKLRKDYNLGKISKENYQNKKLTPISVVGEAPQKGNRKFSLQIQNNCIIFKPQNGSKITLDLPNLRNNYQNVLIELQALAETKQIPYSVKLDSENIYISYEKPELYNKYLRVNTLALDLNPNYIGLSVQSPTSDIIFTKLFDISRLTNKNKQHYELSIIAKYITNIAKHFNCKNLAAEDLEIKSKQHGKGKTFNRNVNNKWNRNLLLQYLSKRCKAFGIKFVEVAAYYSSIIGNMMYRRYTDAVASSLEIGRRALHGATKQKDENFYPDVSIGNNSVHQLAGQKETFSSWKEVGIFLKKKPELRYRVPLPDRKCFQAFINKKSLVTACDGVV